MFRKISILSVVCFSVLALVRCDCDGNGSQDSGQLVEYDGSRDAGGFDSTGTDATGLDTTGFDSSGADAAAGDGGGNPDSSVQTTVCADAPVSTADPGDCNVVDGDGTTLIVGTVLTPTAVYEGGGVTLDTSGNITCVGCDCAAQAASATQIICNQAVVSPGLINPHDHIGWMGDYPRAAEGPSLRYEHRHDWRKGDPSEGEPKVTTSGGSSNADKAWGELRFVLGGGTSINGSGTAPGLLRNLDKSSGLEGLATEAVKYSTFPLGDSSGRLLSSGCDYGDFDPTSVTTEQAYTPHVGEGINDFALNEFRCLTSDDNDGQDLLGANTAIIHGIGFTPVEIALMASEGQKLIWSPRSNISLYGDTAMVTLYHRLGVPIGLGTDWIPSGSMNMLRELACADFLNQNHFGGYFSYQDLWRMATYDAARTCGMHDKIGVLAENKVGDIAIFYDHAVDPFESVVTSEVDDVILVLRGGDVLAGHSALVASLESNCDEVDVCSGTMQRVCLQREVGMSYTELEAAGGGDYGLAYCGVPDGEPTCVPYRDENESIMGSSVYTDPPGAGDRDGDGVADGSDNCPDIFNPIRPVDHGVQADFDTDNVGDVCDVCPLDADTTDCTPFDPNDLDRDGVDDLIDNCPGLPNDQSDRDNDNKGDDCDFCPDDANPDMQGCPATIYDIQNPSAQDHPTEGTRVRVPCAVTAIDSHGFWCQDRGGGHYSGVFVYTNAEPVVGGNPVALGDDLYVDGNYQEFYSLCQLGSPSLTLEQAGTVPDPEVVNPADLATGGSLAEAYEGVLVRIENVVVTNENPDTDDYDEFAVTGDLRIDDQIYDDLDNNFPVGTPFAALVGVMHFTYDNSKLLPRSADDVIFGPPSLDSFNTPLVYQRLTSSATATIPHSLVVSMNRAVEAETVITLSSSDIHIAEVPAQVTLAAGEQSAEVLVRGIAPSDTAVHITATLDTDSVVADVRVLADDTPAEMVSLSPTEATVTIESTVSFSVELSLPSPVSGTTIALAAVSTASGTFGSVPSELVIPYNDMQGSFDFTAGDVDSSGVVSATLNHNTLTADVTVVTQSQAETDISGWQIVQTDSSRTFTFPDNTVVKVGDYVIVGRNVTEAEFFTHWQAATGSHIHYYNTEDSFPSINGDETFTLKNAAGEVIDGPTVAVTTTTNYQRKIPVAAAGEAASWDSIADAPGNATPGSGQEAASTPSGIYISEFSDASGTGNFKFEFIELFVHEPIQ